MSFYWDPAVATKKSEYIEYTTYKENPVRAFHRNNFIAPNQYGFKRWNPEKELPALDGKVALITGAK
jgi:hypothetical protein